MKVKDLITALQAMPQDADTWHLWDGEARTEIEHVWLSKDGNVITADCNEPCYSTETQPAEATASGKFGFWHTTRKK